MPQPLLSTAATDLFFPFTRLDRNLAKLAEVSASLAKIVAATQTLVREHMEKSNLAKNEYPTGQELKATHTSIRVSLCNGGTSGGGRRGTRVQGLVGITASLLVIDTEHDVRKVQEAFSTAAAGILPYALFEKEAHMQTYKSLPEHLKTEIGIRRMICLDSLRASPKDANPPTNSPQGYLSCAADFFRCVCRKD